MCVATNSTEKLKLVEKGGQDIYFNFNATVTFRFKHNRSLPLIGHTGPSAANHALQFLGRN